MNLFRLKRERHATTEAVDEEFKSIMVQLQGLVTYTDQRAPKTSDQGIMWIFLNGTTPELHIRNTDTGAWTKI